MAKQELPQGFISELKADRSLTTQKIFAAERNANEVLALCNLVGHPAAELIHRRVSMEQARAAIRRGLDIKAGRNLQATANKNMDQLGRAFWAAKNDATAESDDAEPGTDLNRRGVAYWYHLG